MLVALSLLFNSLKTSFAPPAFLAAFAWNGASSHVAIAIPIISNKIPITITATSTHIANIIFNFSITTLDTPPNNKANINVSINVVIIHFVFSFISILYTIYDMAMR